MIGLTMSVLALLAQADGLTLEKPEGWQRQENAQTKQVFFIPPNLAAGKDCMVMVFPPQDVAVTAKAYLDQLVQNATRGNQVESVQVSEAGIFQVATVVQKNPQRITFHSAKAITGARTARS